LTLPKFDELMNPLLQALRTLGGSASIAELGDQVARDLGISDDDLSVAHDERRTEFEYRMAWTRTYLKLYGVLGNSGRGVWILTPEGRALQHVEPKEVTKAVRAAARSSRRDGASGSLTLEPVVTPEGALTKQSWREHAMSILLGMPPDAFERLCQRLLREAGFVEVTVTGRSGDGGIDGVGIVRLGGLLGFPILFQCKRYRGVVGPGAIRDFRGAMVGRADRGLVITTGSFSRDAKNEATRDGAPPIDLIDGEQLLDKLMEYRLGLGVRVVEEVVVYPDWFKDI
jgi:restriction system protein